MRIGLFTDSLSNLTLDAALDTCVELGLTDVEFATGNWSTAPHLDLDTLLSDDQSRQELLHKLEDRGLTISALNCSGNVLHPTDTAQAEVLTKTLQLAGLLEVDTIVAMSGLPAGGRGDQWPNFVCSSWPPETGEMLAYQWEEVALPFWHGVIANAALEGVRKIAVEPHAQQLVYNVPTLQRFADALGPMVGANLDPSHLIWMGADIPDVIRALSNRIYHVHAKDVRVEPLARTRGLLDTLPPSSPEARAWNYCTVGHGHGEGWWAVFCSSLRLAGYDGVLSIEHEDICFDSEEGVRRAVDVLGRSVLRQAPSWSPQDL